MQSFRHLIITFARSELALIATILVLQVANDDVFGSSRVDDRVQLEKPLLGASNLSILLLIDFIDTKEMVFVYLHVFAAVIMA